MRTPTDAVEPGPAHGGRPRPPGPPVRCVGDLTVSALGLGAMPLSFPEMVDRRDDAVATIHAALDAGVTLIDTADIYAPSWDSFGHNETLVAEALARWDAPDDARAAVVVVTKGGITRADDGTRVGRWGRDASLDGLRRAAAASARRLRVERPSVWLLHRLEPRVAFEEQIEHLVRLRDEGLAARIGLSNVTTVQLDRALAIAGGPVQGGIVAVENERSPRYRGEADVLTRCAAEGIAYLAWSPLGGVASAADLAAAHPTIARVAAAHGASPQAVALAWLLAAAPVVVPIPGARRASSVRDGLTALGLHLDPDELAAIDASPHEPTSRSPDDLPAPPMRAGG